MTTTYVWAISQYVIADNFNASANDLCEFFEKVGSASHFAHIWKTKARAYMTSDGHFYVAGIGKAPHIVY